MSVPPWRPGEVEPGTCGGGLLRPRNRPFSTLSGRPPGVAVETKRRPCSQAGVCRTTHVAPFRKLASTLGESKISGGRDVYVYVGGGTRDERTMTCMQCISFLLARLSSPYLPPDPITPASQLLVSRWAPSIGFLAIGPPYVWAEDPLPHTHPATTCSTGVGRPTTPIGPPAR